MPEALELESITAKASTSSYVVALSASACGNSRENLVFSFEEVGGVNGLLYKVTVFDGVTEHTLIEDEPLAAGADGYEILNIPMKEARLYIKDASAGNHGALTGKVLYG